MRKITLLLSLLLCVWATAQVTTEPTVSTDTEKHYYTFANNTNTAYKIARQYNQSAPFVSSNTEAPARFTFEQVLDAEGNPETGVYYIKSARINAYLSFNGVAKGGMVKYSATAGDKEKWVLMRKNAGDESDKAVTFVTYDSKNTDEQLGWNPLRSITGSIGLWNTTSSETRSFWQMEEVEVEEPVFTPISGLDNFEPGWYQLKVAVAVENTEKALVLGKYFSCAPVGSWAFTLDGLAARPATFVYIGKNDNNFYIKSSSGRYAYPNVTEALLPQNLLLTAPDTDKSMIKISGTGNGPHVWGGWAGSGVYFVGSSSGNNPTTKNCRFQLSKVDEFLTNKYDVYAVSIPDNIAGEEEIKAAIPVTCNVAGYEGVKTVYNGGVFFFPKGATVQASDFSTPENFAAIEVNSDTKTISIKLNQEAVNTAIQTIETGIETAKNNAGDKFNTVGYPPEVPASLTEAINAAKNNSSYSTIGNMRTQYNNWLASAVMPEDGKAYYLRNIQPSGNGFLLYADNGTLNTKTYSDENKDLSSVFVCHRLENGNYVFLNGDAGKYLIWKGISDGYNSNNGLLDTYESPYCGFTLISRKSNQAGSFTLCSKRVNSNGTVGGDGTFTINTANGTFNAYNNTVCWNASASNLFMLEEAEYYNEVTLRTPSVTDGYNYASLYLPFAATIPAGVEALTATREGDNLVLTAVEGIIPAGEAVVLRSESAQQALFVPAIEAGTPEENNVLHGTMTTTTTPENTYVLHGGFSSGIGFYPYTANTLPVGKAYLTAAEVTFTGDNGVKALLFGDGQATGIGSIGTESNEDAACYDLSGRRVTRPAAGIYVRNGKKVFVK